MEQTLEQEGKREQSRFLARIYGYMAIGLAITAVVSFVLALIFSNWFIGTINDPDTSKANAAFTTYLIIMVVSGIALLIDTFVMHAVLRKGKHSLWIPYIIYAVLMGVFMSSFLIIGIDFYTIGEAFAITAVVFLLMFFIGYFSPVNLNFLGTIAIGLLLVLTLISLFFGIIFIATGTWDVWNIVYSVAVAVIVMIVCAVDGYNIRKLGQSGVVTNNLALYSAFSMYVDFIMIFIRILYLLAASKSRR